MDLQKIYKQIKEENTLKYFIDNESDILTACDENGNTLLHLAILDDNFKTSELLLNAGAYPLIYNANGVTFFSLLVQGGDEKLLKTVLERYPNSLTSYQESELLATAAVAGKKAELKLMLEASFNVKNNYREDSIVSWAVESGCLEILKLLYKYNAPMDQPNEYGMTPLYNASSEGLVDIVGYLIKIGANINYSSEDGCTPLMIACAYNQFETVEILLKKGANKMLKDANGKEALDYAKEGEFVKIIELLSCQ